MGLENKWNRVKINEFCKVLQISEEEVAAYLNMTHAQLNQALSRGKLPGPAVVLLDLWENYYNHVILNEPLKKYPNPVSNHD